LCFIGCRKVNGYAPEYVGINFHIVTVLLCLKFLFFEETIFYFWDFTITFLNSRDEMLAHFLKNLLKEA
ncbi:hypothetical protein, partial [Butyricimonas virosa]|uniref:hypothetical protein n=1 Tax=Butyricimonas virosa TaxID=544645 RepID=UPI00242D2630